MPSRPIHCALELLTFGYCDPDLHRWKDEPARRLGKYHRVSRHDHYNTFDRDWTLRDPFPPSVQWEAFSIANAHGHDVEWAQRYQVHDYFDRYWDSLSRRRRIVFIDMLMTMIHDPVFLKERAGVDVIAGTVQTHHYDGSVTWEPEPTLNRSWREILAQVEGRSPEDLL
jgi:hypothetical protein